MDKTIKSYKKLGIPIRSVQAKHGGKSRTIQSHAKGLTVNEIMKRFSVTGTIPTRPVPGQYLDTTILPNMFDALNMRVNLNNYFNSLPAETRATFKNDPMKLVSFVNDPAKVNDALQMGLVKLNSVGQKNLDEFNAKQAKLKESERTAFKANVSDILKEITPSK